MATHEKSTWKKSQRLGRIIELLERHPRTVDELRTWFDDLPLRTVYRDLADLRAGGFEIQEDPTGSHRYALKARPSRLAYVEALVAHAALRLLYHHSPDRPRSYQVALEKLAAGLPEAVRATAQRSVNIDHRPKADDRTLEVIAKAWIERRVVAFDYTSPGGSRTPRRNEVEVHFVEVSRSNLEMYVIGRRRNYQPAMRTFRLSLIKDILTLPESYEPDPGFDPRTFLSNAWGVIGDANPITVRLRFTAAVKAWLEDRRYPGMGPLEHQADGGVLATIRTGAGNDGLPTELIPWIRGWGANIEVIEPENLRRKWLEEARVLLERYGGTHAE